MAKSLLPDDPHRLKALRGPEQVLEANEASCSLVELPGYMRSIAADTPLAVDLFSGAGGLSLGLHRAGFEVVLACDIRPDSIATHRHHFGGCSEQCDLSNPEVLSQLCRQLNAGGEVALVAGGPPCQPFSRNIRWRKHHDDVSDQHQELNEGRRELWESFLTVVEGVMPRAFLMENVPDIAQTGDQEVFRGIVSRAEAAGYRVHARLVHAWEHGVPQLRPSSCDHVSMSRPWWAHAGVFIVSKARITARVPLAKVASTGLGLETAAGQLGHGTTTSESIPKLVRGLAGRRVGGAKSADEDREGEGTPGRRGGTARHRATPPPARHRRSRP